MTSTVNDEPQHLILFGSFYSLIHKKKNSRLTLCLYNFALFLRGYLMSHENELPTI